MPKSYPPQWAKSLLQKFAHPDTLEEVEGDLQEFFLAWVKEHGHRKAKWKYVITVITLLRPFTRKQRHSSNSIFSLMLQNYFKMSWRTILRNKVSSIINISGLTLGLTTSIIILLTVIDQFQVDQFHANRESIYLLMKNMKTNDGISTGSSTAGPMAEALKSDFPEVKYAARMVGFNELQLDINGKRYFESGIYADVDFFRIMTFPSLAGDVVSSLTNNSSIVITKKMAEKLFASEDPIGKIIVFDKHHTLTVGAVVQDIPSFSSLNFDIVLPFHLFEMENDWLKKWDDNRIQTWMQLHPSADVASFNTKASQLLQKKSNETMVTLFAYPFKDLYLHGNFSNGHPSGGRILAVQLLIGFGVFMLLIASINFMNLATAQSEYRAKEVGVRKVLGAPRKWIIFQFLNESFVITFLSLFIAMAFAFLILPWFNTVAHSSIRFDFNSLTIWGLIISIGLITSLLAGSYPSFFLSRFAPALVLKGRFGNVKGLSIRRALVTFQFTISIFVLISTVIMYFQFEHVKNRPIGYEQENLINVQLDSILSAKFAFVKNEMLKIPDVKSVTGGSGNILYSQGAVTGMDWPGKKPGEELSIVVTEVEYDWSKTMAIKMKIGRDFDPAFESDKDACLINESAMDKMGLKNPIGSVVGGYTVVGVFHNFVYNNPSGIIAPMAVYLRPQQMRYLYLRMNNNTSWPENLTRIEKIIKATSPELPFRFSFTKQEYQSRFNEITNTNLMVSVFSGMTIFISCLGLFGLSGFVAEKRSKEMSIRKVFGATTNRILISLVQDFLKPVVVALLIVIPLTVLIAQSVLSNISYRVALSWWMFASAGLLTLLISAMIVVYHGWRTALESPAIRLKNE